MHGSLSPCSPTTRSKFEIEIADLAAAHWGADATSTYSEEVVERLYSTYLASGKGGRAHAMKLQRLEMSGYLENYLWKHFDAATASWTHVMSAAALVNVKFREAVPAWACFRADPEKFAALFGRVLELPAGKEMDYGERAAHTLFFVHAFAKSLHVRRIFPEFRVHRPFVLLRPTEDDG